MYPGDFPGQLVLPLPLVLLIDCFFHLCLKVLDDFLYKLPSFWGLLVFEPPSVCHRWRLLRLTLPCVPKQSTVMEDSLQQKASRPDF